MTSGNSLRPFAHAQNVLHQCMLGAAACAVFRNTSLHVHGHVQECYIHIHKRRVKHTCSMHVNRPTHKHAYTVSRAHTYAHKPKPTHKPKHTHTYTQTKTHTPTHKQKHTHLHMNKTHTHLHASKNTLLHLVDSTGPPYMKSGGVGQAIECRRRSG